jgi:hypothetical protein
LLKNGFLAFKYGLTGEFKVTKDFKKAGSMRGVLGFPGAYQPGARPEI